MNDAFDVRRRRRARSATDASPRSATSIRHRRTTASSTPPARFVLPGFIQTHMHLCQTLFRGLADDLRAAGLAAHARLAARGRAHAALAARRRRGSPPRSCCCGGTTTVLTMETVHDTDAVFEALAPTGLRAVDRQVPDGRRPRRAGAAARDRRGSALDESAGAGARAGTAPPTGGCAPPSRRDSPCRARASCSKAVGSAVGRRDGLLVHTHASEQRDEVALVRERTGLDNVDVPGRGRAGLAAPVRSRTASGSTTASRRCSPDTT